MASHPYPTEAVIPRNDDIRSASAAIEFASLFGIFSPPPRLGSLRRRQRQVRAELAKLTNDFLPVINELWPRLEDHKYRLASRVRR